MFLKKSEILFVKSKKFSRKKTVVNGRKMAQKRIQKIPWNVENFNNCYKVFVQILKHVLALAWRYFTDKAEKKFFFHQSPKMEVG